MIKHIYNMSGTELLCVVEADPICGDICDECGDCLHCYHDTPCVYGTGGHFWVQYGDDDYECVDPGPQANDQ